MDIPVRYGNGGRGGPAASAGGTDSDSDDSLETKGAPSSSSAARSGVASSTRAAQDDEFTKSLNYIPMRLTEEERRYLAVLEAALEVSEYTDVVDVTYSHLRTSKQSRIMASLVDMLSIACGLMMSNNLAKGESILSNKTLDENLPLFQDLFEIGRRYKIMNPNKMRSTYGKMMYLLMDTKAYSFELKELNFVKPILTVNVFLADKAKGDDSLTRDPLFLRACGLVQGQAISGIDAVGSAGGGAGGGPGDDASASLERAQALQALIAKYATDSLTAEDISRIVQSVADNQAFLDFNVGPVDAMLRHLKQSFHPHKIDGDFSLELATRGNQRKSSKGGYFSSNFGFSLSYRGDGACLSHDHATQYNFVLQSLTLWSYIMRCMPRLWVWADRDMTSEPYRLVDTGQGYQRLQHCPHVRSLMNNILSKVQSKCGPWVGLSVVHLGDRDVPNALVFIDKYTQVPSILAPIASALERLPALAQDPAFHAYVVAEWASIDGLKMQILSDFFKHGYDGSGDDGGSCIDGRLTSAWNWCSKLHKKPFYHAFMFCGFQGFDGDWKDGS